MLRRSPGFDVPDFLAAGPRDVMVPEGGYQAAREVLLQAEIVSEDVPRPQRADGAQALKLTAAIAVGGALATVVAWALVEFGA